MLRDDIIEYSLEGHHSEEEGVKLRKTIWKVTAILTIITALEVAVGIMFPKSAVSEGVWTAIKISYIVLTLVKAAYIVLSFMHLGDERKAMRYVILVPYFIFALYLIFVLINEGNAIFAALTQYAS